MKILTVPNPILTQKARPVGKIDANIRRIISQMKEALAQSKIGVGLAAPQIGIPLQIFIVAYHKPHESYEAHKFLVFLNPQLSNKSSPNRGTKKRRYDLRKKRALEGCLSLPNVWGKVNRAHPLKLKYLNEKGERKQRTFRGFLATIVQHEIDHLNGILFTEHVLSQGKKLYRQVKDKKTGKAVMKEIGI